MIITTWSSRFLSFKRHLKLLQSLIFGAIFVVVFETDFDNNSFKSQNRKRKKM